MNQEYRPLTLAQYLSNYDHLAITSTLLSLVGVVNVIEYIENRDPKIFISFVVAVIFFIVSIYNVRASRFYRPLPLLSETKFFYPFLSFKTKCIKLFSRVHDINRLKQHFFPGNSEEMNTQAKHLIITGRSGVGKSILIYSFLIPRLEKFIKSNKTSLDFIAVRNYDTALSTLIGELRDEIKTTEQSRILTEVGRVIEKDDTPDEWYLNLRVLFDDLFRSFPKNKQVIIFFDQFERLLSRSREAQNSTNDTARVRKVIAVFLAATRKAANVSTIIAVRSDRLADAISDVGESERRFAQGHNSSAHQVIEDIVRIVNINGFNLQEHKDACDEIRTQFKQMLGDNHDIDPIFEALELAKPEKSNSFMIQLLGYMGEHFRSEEQAISSLLDGTGGSIDQTLTHYTSMLTRMFAAASNFSDAERNFACIVYTIALDNKVSGLTISRADIARLSHYPKQIVSEIVEFLISLEVLEERRDKYRFVHDVLIDHFLSTEVFDISAEFRDSVRRLSEKGGDKSHFVVPNLTENLFDFVNIQFFDWAKFLLLMVIFFILFRIVSPDLLYPVMSGWHAFIDNRFEGLVVQADFDRIVHISIFLVQYVWITFMYYIDRNYFSYVLKGRPVLRLVSRCSAPLGGVLGCLFAFMPSLFLIPISVGGLGMASVLLVMSFSDEYNPEMSRMCFKWGWRTALNMILTVLLWPLIYLMLENVAVMKEEGSVSVIGTLAALDIYVICLCYISIWFIFKPGQGSQHGWSGMLALADRKTNDNG